MTGDASGFVVATVPAVVPAGQYKIGLANNSAGQHRFHRGWRAAGGTGPVGGVHRAVDANPNGPPAGVFDAEGPSSAKPGQEHQKVFDLTQPGQYGFFCPITTPDGTPHYRLGFVGLFTVAAAP